MENLLALATDSNKMTEAQTYIGMNLALSNHRNEARPHLLWVTENGNRSYFEYQLALMWIDLLERGKRN
jgi:hypothetical protein